MSTHGENCLFIYKILLCGHNSYPARRMIPILSFFRKRHRLTLLEKETQLIDMYVDFWITLYNKVSIYGRVGNERFLASIFAWMMSSNFWNVKKHGLIDTDVSGQPICPIIRDQLVLWPLKMGPIDIPEKSVMHSHCTLRNIAEEPSSLGIVLYVGRSSCKVS